MRRAFITNFSLLIMLNLIVKGVWVLGIDLQVQNTVGAEQYGMYYALLNLSFLLNMFLDLGITNFNTYNISQNAQLVSKHFSRIFSLKIFLGFIYMICTVLLAVISGYHMPQLMLLLILSLNQFLNSFILYLRSNLAALQLYASYSITSVLDRFIMIFLIGAMLWSGFFDHSFRIEWFIYAQTIAYALSALISFILVWRKARPFKPLIQLPFSILILKKSFPYALLILLMMIYNRSDAVLIERLLPDGKLQAGIYAQAFRLMDAANMIAFLAAGLLFPMFARLLKEKSRIDNLISLSFRIIVWPSIIGAATIFVFQEEIMSFLYIEHTIKSAQILGWLMGCFVAVSISYIFGTLLTANSNLKQLNVMAICIVILNISLNCMLIPALAARGAGIAAFISQWTVVIVQIALVQYFFRFPLNTWLIRQSVILLACVVFIGLAVRHWHGSWLLGACMMFAACTMLGFVLKLFNIKEIHQFIAANKVS